MFDQIFAIILETAREDVLSYYACIFTQRKSHKGFRLVPKVVTLNDLERRYGRYFVSF